MFNDDFDEFRARSYSGGFLSFAADGKRSISDPARCFTSTATDSNSAGNDVTAVPDTDAPSGRVRERCHSDEMPIRKLSAPATGTCYCMHRSSCSLTAFVIRMRWIGTSWKWKRCDPGSWAIRSRNRLFPRGRSRHSRWRPTSSPAVENCSVKRRAALHRRRRSAGVSIGDAPHPRRRVSW